VGDIMKKRCYIFIFLIFFCFHKNTIAELVASWDFNEGTGTSLHDKSGNGNDGTISGAQWMPGLSGTSLYFDGSNDYVRILDPHPFKLQKFTVTCWVKPEDPFVAQERTLFCNIEAQRPSTSTGFIIRFNSQGLSFCVARTDGINWLNIYEKVNVYGECYHFVACSYDGVKMKLFFDNKLISEASYTGGVKYNNISPYIGADPNNEDLKGYYKGYIDEMKVFDHALSSSEMLNLFNEYKEQCIFTDPIIPIPSPTTNSKPSFFWHSITNATSYTLKIDTTKTFRNPIINTIVKDTFYHSIINLPVKTIYWQVTANKDDIAMFSSIDSFTITDPSIPVLVHFTPKITQERKPLLKWNPVQTASTYTLEIGNDPNFLNPLYIVPAVDTQFSPTIDLPYGSTFWRVKSDLSSSWSIIDTFWIVPDTVPFLIRFNGSQVSTKTPIFMWYSVDGVNTYTIRIARNKNCTGGYVIPNSDTTYTSPLELDNGKWFWQVGCSNDPKTFSYPDSFEILTTSTFNVNFQEISKQRYNLKYGNGKLAISGI